LLIEDNNYYLTYIMEFNLHKIKLLVQLSNSMGDVVRDILEVLSQKGEVKIAELATLLKSSEESVRSALNTLENLGLVEKSNNLLVRLTDDARRLLSK